MTETVPEDPMLHDPADTLDPLADAEDAVVKNRAKVGSARPSSLLYTYGPGAIMDLPGFSVMPAGLDDWEPIWKRREHIPTIIEPRLLNVARMHLGNQVDALQLCPRGLEHAFGEPYAVSADGAVGPSMGARTLAEQTLLPAAAVVPMDPSLPLDLAALLGCAVTTGVGAVMRSAAVRLGQSTLVIGCGGVGLAAIQGARLARAAGIIAADTVAAQLVTATANGATDTVDASEDDVVTAVRELTGGAGVDHGIEVVGVPATIRAAYDATRRGGTVTLVGAAGIEETVTFSALSMMADGKTIRGSVYGSSDPARDIPVLAELARRGRLDLEALVTRRIGIDDVEAAFTDMAAGRGARSVVCFEG